MKSSGAFQHRVGQTVLNITSALVSWVLIWLILSILIRSFTPDPITQIAGPLTDEATRHLLTVEFGLDKPVLLESMTRASKMIVGDWGVSWQSQLPVKEVLFLPAMLSITMALFATVFTLIFTFAFGVLIVQKEFQFVSKSRKTVYAVLIFASAIPAFVVALIVTHSPIPDLLHLPRSGLFMNEEFSSGSLMLPIFCLFISGFGLVIPRLSSEVERISRSEWFRYLVLLGYEPTFGLFFHARYLLLRLFGDLFAILFIFYITSAIGVEYVFSIPGLGTILLDAIQLGDVPVTLGVVALATVLTIFTLFIRDVFSYGLPPKLRTTAGGG